MGLGSGFVNLFKNWGKGIGNAADNFWLGANAQSTRKAIRDEIEKKFKSKIDLAHRAESKRAANIKDLDAKLNESKANRKQAQDVWQQQYDAALASAKNQRQTDIDNYNAQLKTYKEALADANAGKQNILAQLQAKEAQYNPYRTIFTDVNTGTKYVFDPSTGKYEELSTFYKKLKPKEQKAIQSYDNRLIDVNTNRVLNPFDESTNNMYKGYSAFDNYYPTKISTQDAIALRDAENQIKLADANLRGWKKQSQPKAWDDNVDLKPFKTTYEKTNGKLPKEYSFNGQNYSKESELEKAYKEALAHEQNRKDLADEVASRYASKRDAEIAQRIQDAKDMNKAKVALGGTLGAGALYAGARAMYGGDDTPDNTDNTNNIDNTDNTYTGEPDPDFNVEKEGQAILNNEQQSDTAPINAGFDPDKADALAAAAYDKGVEDSNSIESNGDLGNNIAAKTGGHTIDDGLFELLKAMENPYKANAVADYIYSRYGNDPDVQRLGWRGWLNKYYGDSLRSRMNIDPSGYNGMHIA